MREIQYRLSRVVIAAVILGGGESRSGDRGTYATPKEW